MKNKLIILCSALLLLAILSVLYVSLNTNDSLCYDFNIYPKIWCYTVIIPLIFLLSAFTVFFTLFHVLRVLAVLKPRAVSAAAVTVSVCLVLHFAAVILLLAFGIFGRYLNFIADTPYLFIIPGIIYGSLSFEKPRRRDKTGS